LNRANRDLNEIKQEIQIFQVTKDSVQNHSKTEELNAGARANLELDLFSRDKKVQSRYVQFAFFLFLDFVWLGCVTLLGCDKP